MVLGALMGSTSPPNLEKMHILVETGIPPFIEVLFNPNQITIQRSAHWKDWPTAESDTGKKQFTHGEPATLSMDLFFDTYEQNIDVRLFTKQIYALTIINSHLHRPPFCVLMWGMFDISGDIMSRWILQNLTQRFDLFLPNGTPVRATLSCTFRQWREDLLESLLMNLMSSDVDKTHIVQRGETLNSIAAYYYNDPTMWRHIAEANQIINPRYLEIGARLVIPKLATNQNKSERKI
ncbi:MAG: LysM peptidoglycan-binding domain-containing protein [Anaerolineaceae bacterium]|nr:LysM peptidoglycan-binding domain-containing protein [Anaerolineaceae bacterium]